MRVRSVIAVASLSVAHLFASTATSHAVIDGSVSTRAPWAVHILVDGASTCTGTVVAREWVLTADHCFHNVDDAAIAFRVGALDQRQGRLLRPVPGSRAGSPTADMMLIKVPGLDVPSADIAAPADLAVGARVTAFGWGATCSDRPEDDCQSDVLKQAALTVLPNTDQRCLDEHLVGPEPTDFCAERIDGVPAGGDSGGPLMLTLPGGEQKLVGVLSGSDRERLVGAGNVARQRAWVDEVTKTRTAYPRAV